MDLMTHSLAKKDLNLTSQPCLEAINQRNHGHRATSVVSEINPGPLQSSLMHVVTQLHPNPKLQALMVMGLTWRKMMMTLTF